MAAGKSKWIGFPYQPAHHQAAFERSNNECREFPRVNMGTNLPFLLPLPHDHLQPIQPCMEGVAGLVAKLTVAIIGFDRGVQKRASAWNQADPHFPKVPQKLTQTINGIRDIVRSCEARIHDKFPSMIEGFSSQFLLAVEMTINSALFEAGRLHEIGEGGALITLLIEKWRCSTNDFLTRLFAFTHR
jgi:hypothetical protein